MTSTASSKAQLEKYLKIYLGVNGVSLILLGLWCGLDPFLTSELIGLRLEGPKGIAEYLAVYGGIEFGLGLFFCLTMARKEYQFSGLLLAVLMYASIVVFRGGSMVIHGPTSGAGWLLYTLEVSCFLLGLLLLRKITPDKPRTASGN